MLTRSMKYAVRSAHRLAIVHRLADGTRITLIGEEAECLKTLIKTLEAIDEDRLGSKPSRRFCAAFDDLCLGYFERKAP